MIQTRLRIVRMNMSKELPSILVGTTIAEKWIVVQINSLASYIDEHLHSYMFESRESLPYSLNVVIAKNEIDSAI